MASYVKELEDPNWQVNLVVYLKLSTLIKLSVEITLHGTPYVDSIQEHAMFLVDFLILEITYTSINRNITFP